MPPKKLKPAAKKIIKDIFQAEIYQDWESKWPGVDINPFIRKYRKSLGKFHGAYPTPTNIPDIPTGMVRTGGAAETTWLQDRGKLTTGFFVNVVDHSHGSKYQRAFLERANEAAFSDLMSKKEKTDGKPPTVKDLAGWKWEEDEAAFPNAAAVRTGLLSALVAHMLQVAQVAERDGGKALKKVMVMEEKEADAAEGGPVVEHDAETKIKQVAEAARLMGNSSVILREIEELWKGEKIE